MNRYKKIALASLITSIVFAVFHHILLFVTQQSADLQSVLLNVLPYGLPILAFSLALRECYLDKPQWKMPAIVLAILFMICYAAMVLHVTLAYIIGCVILQTASYINIYFNVPIFYGIASAVLFIAWLMVKARKAEQALNAEAENEVKAKGRLVTGKILFALPFALIAVMVIHCGTLLIIALSRPSTGFPNTSFPSWGTPLIAGLIYLLAIAACFTVWFVYNRLVNKAANAHG